MTYSVIWTTNCLLKTKAFDDAEKAWRYYLQKPKDSQIVFDDQSSFTARHWRNGDNILTIEEAKERFLQMVEREWLNKQNHK